MRRVATATAARAAKVVRAAIELLDEARAAFKASGREVWVTAPFDEQGWPLKRLQQSADTIVLMAYDQHYGGGDPGPNAGQDWYEAELDKRFSALDPARTVLAPEALSMGLVDHVTAPDQLLAQALALAERIAANAPVAVRMAKAAVHRGADLSLADGLQLERDMATFVYTTQDAKEGPLAFVEKRPPHWQDR